MGSSGAVVRVRPAGGDFAESLWEERASEQGHRFVVCTELLAPVTEDCVERAGDAERGRHRPPGALRRSASGPAGGTCLSFPTRALAMAGNAARHWKLCQTPVGHSGLRYLVPETPEESGTQRSLFFYSLQLNLFPQSPQSSQVLESDPDPRGSSRCASRWLPSSPGNPEKVPESWKLRSPAGDTWEQLHIYEVLVFDRHGEFCQILLRSPQPLLKI